MSEKPSRDDAHLLEAKLDSKLVYDGGFLKVRRDNVRLPNGRDAWREYIVHPGAVVVIAQLDDGRLLVERQHRYPVGMVMTEFPAGSSIRARTRWSAPSASCSRKRATARRSGLMRAPCTSPSPIRPRSSTFISRAR
jgi:ADP-ribose pyrophosphatase